jgi:hypothetical protein
LIPSRYHWDQLDAKVIVLDINFPVRMCTGSILREVALGVKNYNSSKKPFLLNYGEWHGGGGAAVYAVTQLQLNYPLICEYDQSEVNLVVLECP